jgi:hypothetical protein
LLTGKGLSLIHVVLATAAFGFQASNRDVNIAALQLGRCCGFVLHDFASRRRLVWAGFLGFVVGFGAVFDGTIALWASHFWAVVGWSNL